VLTDRFWKREYNGRADVIGKTILLDSHPIEIVGVSEPGFTGIDVGSTTDILTPICAERLIHGETTLLDRRASTWLRIVGRPARGLSPQQAAARLNTLAPEIFKATLPENLAKEDQDGYLARTFVTESARTGLSFLRDRYRRALPVLMVIAGLVLLIACANVANLLLARGASRQRDISIRLALGAGRGRLIRQLLMESLLLAGIGSGLGLVFARSGAQLLVSYLQVYLDLTPDVRVLGFAIGAAVLTGLLFGIAPAWRGSQVSRSRS
jgi:putative ABC transport system permease protein